MAVIGVHLWTNLRPAFQHIFTTLAGIRLAISVFHGVTQIHTPSRPARLTEGRRWSLHRPNTFNALRLGMDIQQGGCCPSNKQAGNRKLGMHEPSKDLVQVVTVVNADSENFSDGRP